MSAPPITTEEILQEGLPRLWRLLRAARLGHDPATLINVQDLLLRMGADHRLPRDPKRLRGLIGPLVCRSPEDQVRFGKLFQLWLAGDEPPEPTTDHAVQAGGPHNIARQWVDRELADTAQPGAPLKAKPPPQDPPRPEPKWIALGLCLLLVLGGWGMHAWVYAKWPFAPELKSNGAGTVPVPVAVYKSQGSAAISDDATWLDLQPQPIPPRLPVEPPTLRPSKQTQGQLAGWLAPGLPVSGLLLWLGWRYWRRWIALRRGPADPNNPLRHLRVRAPTDDLFGDQEVRNALRALHTPVFHPSRRLNETATVERSVHANGLFQPVFADRPEIPEIVVLAEFRHGQDHVAGLGDRVVELLRRAGLSVHRFDYRDDPRYVREADGRRRLRRLSQIAARHVGARLILVGDPSILLNVWDGGLHGWARRLLDWERRGILNTRPGRGDWEERLMEEGFRLAPLNSTGLGLMAKGLSAPMERSEWSSTGTDAAQLTLDPLPVGLRDEESLLRPKPPEPAERIGLLPLLRAYLDGTGIYLLGAMAVYPQVHWSLTRALDRSLFSEPGAMASRERRMLRLAQLPWCRYGYMPDWLREDLIDALIPSQGERIRRLYLALFRGVTGGEGEIVLPIAMPPRPRDWWAALRSRWRAHDRRWWRFLSDLFVLGGRASVYRDPIFARLMLGGGRRLDLKLPGELARRFPALQRLGALLYVGGVILAAGAVGAAAVALWQGYGAAGFEQWLMARQREEHGAVAVAIAVAPPGRELGERLGATLQARGFGNVEIREAANATGKPPVYRYGAGVEPEIAAYIAWRLAYLSYQDQQPGRPLGHPDTALPDNEVRITLSRGLEPTPDFVLRDPLSRPLIPGDRKLFSSPDNFAKEAAVDVEFSDPLKDGGQGPRMAVIPAGGFSMGSPEDEAGRDSDEGPQHQVEIPRSFALGVTEVSFAEYDRFAKATGRELPGDEGWGRGSRPVINVSWGDATDYARWLSQQTGQAYRLPAEAEWEYAARAGGSTAYFWGGDAVGACQYANGYDQAGKREHDFGWDNLECDDGFAVSAPVGSFRSNAFGLADMSGNVYEWTGDCWHADYQNAPTDGSAWLDDAGGDCSQRVLRGGGWFIKPRFLRSAYRSRYSADGTINDVGFRLARAL